MSDQSQTDQVDNLVQQATTLAQGAPQPLRRVRVQAEGSVVELEWPEPTETGAGAAPTAVATPVAVADAPAPAEDASADHHRVCAPLVGTFYEAPQPGAPSFVRVGDVVEPGQQVGIIEAMKLMNPIEADGRGRVVEVVAGNGTSVQFGDVLIVLDTADES